MSHYSLHWVWADRNCHQEKVFFLFFFFLATVNNFSKGKQIKAPHLQAIKGFGLTQIGVSDSFFLRHLSTEGSYCGRDKSS